jgi:hypothetical protein
MSPLATYQQAFARLVINQRGGRASPHKICMLLAVLDLARAGACPSTASSSGRRCWSATTAFSTR